MARADAYSEAVKSPVTKYVTWSSNDKCFSYYDREKKVNVPLKLPVKIIHFRDFASIKGFDDRSQSSIYSNEVTSVKNEPLVVRSFKGGELIKGLYADIKLKLREMGGKYNMSMYAMVDGELVNISIGGAILQHWSDFSKDNRKSFLTNYINVDSALELKKGSVKYSVPAFTLGATIESKVSAEADKLDDELLEYFKKRTQQSNTDNTVIETHAEEVPAPKFADLPAETNDDLPW
jgi:hypothetical protein